MLISMGSEHHLVTNELNQNRLTDPYSAPFINRPSLLSSSQIQHQQFNTVVNPELPLQSPHAFQLPSTSAQAQAIAFQNHGFMPVNGMPWRCPDWMATPSGSLMNFHGYKQSRLPFKRKAATDMESMIKAKQLITDEKMAAHLNGMHISSDYTAHTMNQMDEMNGMASTESPSGYPCSLQDIEEKLKRAQRITVSDVVRTIQDEPLLPAAIMERYEKPCKALVVWQPPQRITDLIISNATQREENNDGETSNNNNNNVEFIEDGNNAVQMELDN